MSFARFLLGGEGCPGVGIHVPEVLALPGEFGMLFQVLGGFKIDAAGMAG